LVIVIVVAVVAGVVLGYKPSSPSTGTITATSTYTPPHTTSSSSTTSSTSTLAPGSVVVVPPDSNFTVDAQVCKYFYFNDESYYANFTGSFNANPEVALYLLNITSYSLALASGSSIVSYTFATTGNDNQYLANHLMVTGYTFNLSIPQGQYYAGFCDWTNAPTVVSTNSTGISAVW